MNKLKGSLVQFNSLKQFYPVGYVFIHTSDKFDPNKFILGTKWKKLPDNTYIVNTTDLNAGFYKKESIIIDNTNIEVFNQSTENDGTHSHGYTKQNWRYNDSHGSSTVECKNGEDTNSFGSSNSTHSHTVKIGSNIPVDVNNKINHTKLNIWLRIK